MQGFRLQTLLLSTENIIQFFKEQMSLEKGKKGICLSSDTTEKSQEDLKREAAERKRKEILNGLEQRKCKTLDRYIQANCKCIDGFYDNGINKECQICPYPCLTCENGTSFCQTCNKRPFISLQHFVSEEKIQKFDEYIQKELSIFNDEDRAQKGFNFRPNHGKAIWLYNKTNWKKSYGFRHHRKYRHSDFYYKGNYTQIQEFVKDLDFFEYTGINFVIYNQPGDSGSEHKDHTFKDIISEFFWFSGNTAKQFFARDPLTNEKKYVTSYMAYFDDSVSHSISPSDRYQYTFRIDGKFKPWVRQYILDNYDFPNDQRRNVFAQQQNNLHKCPEHPQPCEEYTPETEKVEPEKAQYS